MKYILLAILWVIWCALHSGLISLPVTERLRKKSPGFFRYYRLLYNLFAMASLLPVLMYAYAMRSEPMISWAGGWKVVPISLGVISLVLFVSGGRRYDLLQFLGFRQIRNENTCSVLTDDCSLDTRGILSVVRHPWYAGGILILWARPLDPSALLTNLVLCGYLIVGAFLEERKLSILFGDQYTAYQHRVPMFFPIGRRSGRRD